MTVAQVRATLGVSRRSVYNFIADNKLHRVRLSARMLRFRSEEVLRLADSEFVPLRIPGLRGHAANPAN
jgi:predicted DNA-binding transcriptional regulator AlpA